MLIACAGYVTNQIINFALIEADYLLSTSFSLMRAEHIKTMRAILLLSFLLLLNIAFGIEKVYRVFVIYV